MKSGVGLEHDFIVENFFSRINDSLKTHDDKLLFNGTRNETFQMSFRKLSKNLTRSDVI